VQPACPVVLRTQQALLPEQEPSAVKTNV